MENQSNGFVREKDGQSSTGGLGKHTGHNFDQLSCAAQGRNDENRRRPANDIWPTCRAHFLSGYRYGPRTMCHQPEPPFFEPVPLPSAGDCEMIASAFGNERRPV